MLLYSLVWDSCRVDTVILRGLEEGENKRMQRQRWCHMRMLGSQTVFTPVLGLVCGACLSFISSLASPASCAQVSSFPACTTFNSFPRILTLGLSFAKPSSIRKCWPEYIHSSCLRLASQDLYKTFPKPSNICSSNVFTWSHIIAGLSFLG